MGVSSFLLCCFFVTLNSNERNLRLKPIYTNIETSPRLWRTVKYEEVYLKEYVDYFSGKESLSDYFDFYNNERNHSSLGKRTTAEVYFENSNQRKEIM